jgi:hypothetical protein
MNNKIYTSTSMKALKAINYVGSDKNIAKVGILLKIMSVL